MEMFATKDHPDNTINRITKLEKSVKIIEASAKKIDALEDANDRIDHLET